MSIEDLRCHNDESVIEYSFLYTLHIALAIEMLGCAKPWRNSERNATDTQPTEMSHKHLHPSPIE